MIGVDNMGSDSIHHPFPELNSFIVSDDGDATHRWNPVGMPTGFTAGTPIRTRFSRLSFRGSSGRVPGNFRTRFLGWNSAHTGESLSAVDST